MADIISISISLFGLVASQVWALIRKRPLLKVRFCDPQGKFLSKPPVVEYWYPGEGWVSFRLRGYIRPSNKGPSECTIDQVYVTLQAKGQEIERKAVCPALNGKRLGQFDTIVEAVEVSADTLIRDYRIQKLVGFKTENCKVQLVVEAPRAKAVVPLSLQQWKE